MSIAKTAGSDSPTRAEGMNGLAKGLAIIESFSLARSRLTVSQAAAASDTSPAAARRCLLTLAELGYVSYDGKYFTPTPRLTLLGAAYTGTAALPQLAQPRLEAVRDELQESISLAVLEGSYSAIIARAEADRTVSAFIRLGSRIPAWHSATGRVLLTSLTENELDEHLATANLEASTTKAIVDPNEIRQRVRQAGEAGYAFTDEEIEYGVRTMAVVVKDSRGETRAAMSLSASAGRWTLADMHTQFLPVLQREATLLGRML
ncbi:MAG: IclR family transcriptional regulator C-terminal domain-containing protein [Microbacterium sp.]|uniref:IclR family transcriptional regulator domain-containing protein n=1 Tax=Microbacterium sp. TaxID=51671 RepID=UPI00272599FC|nr:IclR family transcriptional regulator C-terminal domain-containing protein [Microbacterium sp.]MDO8383869.1 IclR family transcriptional regulator C-terminal domain-containing protein [Microbacterium sp.]